MTIDKRASVEHRARVLFRCALPALVCIAQVLGFAFGAESPLRNAAQWEEVFRGVSIASLETSSPRPIRAYAVRIRLDAAGLSFLATPGNGDLPGETTALKTSTFLKKYGLQVAINAGPFSPVATLEGTPQDLLGVHVSRNRLVSPWEEKLPALLITGAKQVIIAPEAVDLSEVETAIGGFGVVLREGKAIPGDDSLHPRTAAGVSADGKTMVLLVIDGRQKGYSEGATTAEVGQWLKALGCSAGINLDGGGSTTLVIQDQQGQPRVLNRPIHAGVPGTERVVGSHLGVYAEKLQPADNAKSQTN